VLTRRSLDYAHGSDDCSDCSPMWLRGPRSLLSPVSTIHGMSPSAYRSLENRSSSVLEEPGVLRMSRLIWDR
jgi:hypothetical protein